MKINEFKANLHMHTSDDPRDYIEYSAYEAIKEAARLGFEVIAITCHGKFVNNKEYIEYGEKNGVLIIPGIEAFIEKKHVVILNPQKNIESVNTFEDLIDYKKNNPNIFIIAPHPFFPSFSSLFGKFKKNVQLFDAIEHSWFFSKLIDFNTKAIDTAKKHKLPFISTSDTHDLSFLNDNFAIIHAKEKTIQSVFDAIKNGNFTNISKPQKSSCKMIFYLLSQVYKNTFLKKSKSKPQQ